MTSWRVPLFALGFRPFYLLAAALAALAVPWWLLQHAGIAGDAGGLPAMARHGHEMVFGFAAAVIAGFLLTAVRNWTGRPTPDGAALAGLAALWLLGRAGLWLAYGVWSALLDLAFLPAIAAAIALPLWRSRNRRNYFIVALLLLLAAANLCFHAALLGWAGFAWQMPVHAALFVVVLIVAVMGGRVIPAFTANALPGVRSRRLPWLEHASLAALALALAAALWLPASPLAALSCAGAALLHLARLALWSPLSTRERPILWILHLSYLWIPLGLALLAAAAVTPAVPPAAGLHALSIGAVGGMIIGMITRTARGHTGRALEAGRAEVAAYVLVHVAAAARVAGITLLPSWYAATLALAAAAWSIAFLLYLREYVPVLTRPRVDGRPG